MTQQERMAWTRRVISLPFHEGLQLLVQQFLQTGEITLTGIPFPESASDWEFNSRVETLQTAFEKFERSKILRPCAMEPA
jgi:hypothetical protein